MAEKPEHLSKEHTQVSKQDAKVRRQKLDTAAESACSQESRVPGRAPPTVPRSDKPSGDSEEWEHSREGWGRWLRSAASRFSVALVLFFYWRTAISIKSVSWRKGSKEGRKRDRGD